ncbi:MAG TPA: MFS transporter [Steroidobacteraceae bacterium]|nr:MFS transporter [Steroidobacteraceae bacterium]
MSSPLSRREPAGLYPWYVLGVLFLVYVLNFIDRSILSILAQDIKADLHLGDAQLGFLYGTAFAVFYALFGIPLGRLADSWYRGRLIAIGLAIWSAMTALSGLAGSYGQLAVARIGVGIGEASASPAAYSLLADHFPARRRALVLAIYTAGLYVGGGLSLPLGGWIAHAWNHSYAHGAAPLGLAGWQVAFLAVGVPGLLLALWVLTLHEPARGAAEGHPSPVVTPGAWRAFAFELAAILPPITLWSVARFPGALRRNLLLLGAIAGVALFLARVTGDALQWGTIGLGIYAVTSWTQMLYATDRPTYSLLFGTRAIVFALCGFGMIAFVSYSLFFWGPPYAIRTFGVGADVAGLMLGVPGALASAAGCVTGGHLSDVWKRRDPRGRVFVCMLAATLPAPLLVAALAVKDVGLFYLIMPLTLFVAYFWVGPAVAAIQDCVLPRMRGTAGAVFLLAVSILGLGLGPYATGKAAALTGSLRTGMLSMIGVMPLALLLLWLASRTIGSAEQSRAARARDAGEP